MTSIKHYHNHQVKNLPVHLRQYSAEQGYECYTAADHALWRYLIRLNALIYGSGSIAGTSGLSTERIPTPEEMNEALGSVFWTVIPVTEPIPPFVFMEFLSKRILPVSPIIRSLSGVSQYSGTDIFYSAALCVLILADPDYLDQLGQLGNKAIYSSKDIQLQQAIRDFTQLKNAEEPDPLALRKAEKLINFHQKSSTEPSEATLLNHLYLWTTAYRLAGSSDQYRVQGAAFQSSLKEYNQVQNPEIKKYKLSMDALYSAPKPVGPQDYYFVADTPELYRILKELANSMAFVRGGAEGILKAIASQTVCTAVYSSGLQVSGVFCDLRMDPEDQLQFIKTCGPTVLSFAHQQLENQGSSNHPDGFSSPVGRIKHLNKALEDATEEELEELGIIPGAETILDFESGLVLKGTALSILRRELKIILISFAEASLMDEQGNHYFKPGWGKFDMAVGEKIVSVYAGAANKDAYAGSDVIEKKEQTQDDDEKTKKYHKLFEIVRNCRETRSGFEQLKAVWKELKTNYRDDWLCTLEILEIFEKENTFQELAGEIRIYLEQKASNDIEQNRLIRDGFKLIYQL